MRAYSPDERAWTVDRRPEPAGVLQKFRPSATWVVEARTDGEVRRWMAPSRRAARSLVDEVALALRTGGEGPPGELADDDPPVSG